MKLKIIFGIIIIVLAVCTLYFYNTESKPYQINTQNTKPNTTSTIDYTDLENRVGQMLMVGFRGTTINGSSTIAKEIKSLNLGGIILFDYDLPSKSSVRNIISPTQTKKLISQLQSYADTPLFIGIDAEGGLVNRLKPKFGFITVPSHEDLGKLPVSKTREASTALAKELKELGININFAPVVDVNVNPENPVIGKLGRSFSADPELVTKYASAFIASQNAEGIISVIKHFPGHGSSGTDSHIGLVDITTSYKGEELIPYQNIITKNQVDAVMSAHVMNRNIDAKYPATLSSKFLQDILRTKLGFKGVIVSDDMEMGAIVKNFGFEEALIQAINSGIDLLVLSNNIETYDDEIAAKAKTVIVDAVQKGKISPERIIDASEKIKALKTKYKIL